MLYSVQLLPVASSNLLCLLVGDIRYHSSGIFLLGWEHKMIFRDARVHPELASSNRPYFSMLLYPYALASTIDYMTDCASG